MLPPNVTYETFGTDFSNILNPENTSLNQPLLILEQYKVLSKLKKIDVKLTQNIPEFIFPSNLVSANVSTPVNSEKITFIIQPESKLKQLILRCPVLKNL